MGGPKAVIRGTCIAEVTLLNRRKADTRELLTRELTVAKSALQPNPTVPQLRNITQLTVALKDLDVGNVKKAMLNLKRLY